MLNNFRNLHSLYQSLGARWLMFRVGYALRMRTGLIRKQNPSYPWQERPLQVWLRESIPSGTKDYAGWRTQNSPGFFFRVPQAGRSGSITESQILGAVSWDPHIAEQEAERILDGEIRYFAHESIKTGFPPDWHRDPFSGRKVNAGRHWSQISNDGDVDIKFIWEASRFSMVYTLVRAYAFTRDPKFVEAFWELLESWAESNPPNTGPNWMDGQEAALRIMAWTFGFHAFLEAPPTTPERMVKFTVMVAAHAERIFRNISYAISTHGNHTISEALGLWLVGLLFPELKDAGKYFTLGRRLLEQEALAQIFPDGSYSMYSLNYHRFILHIYLYAIRLGELNGVPFSEALRGRVAKSIDYLAQLIDAKTGQMPVYGSNDGALVLPLNNCDFTDYRPLLQLGSFLTKGKLLFDPGPWDEDLFWLCGEEFISKIPSGETGRLNPGDLRDSFSHGGTYLLHGVNSRAVIRCTDYRARPSHADQLHVDLWWHGTHIACDAGTYLYSGEGVWRNGLAHTSVHNTVTVDRRDQMRMVSRFTWTDWARGRVLQHNDRIWQGEHDGYARLSDPVSHKRTVLSLDGDRWLVVDHLRGKQSHHYALHWLLGDFPHELHEQFVLLVVDSTKYKVHIGLLEGRSSFSIVRADENSTRGWRSRYYAHKEPAISVMLEADQPEVLFWSFFGLEGDSVEMRASVLKITTEAGETSIHNIRSLHSTL